MDTAVAVFAIVGILAELIVTVSLIHRTSNLERRILDIEEAAELREFEL